VVSSGVEPSRTRRSLGEAFDPRANSLNFLRLAFAAVVLVDHAHFLGGFGETSVAGKTTPGTLAVYGFFAISGFLIAGSAARLGFGTYLTRRFLRIFPAFWVVLLVTALAIAPIAVWAADDGDCRGACLLTGPDGGLRYITVNASLWIFQPDIASTPVGVELPAVWNGSLWTLAFEFGAYLILAGLAVLGILRHRAAVAVLTFVCWAALALVTVDPAINAAVTFFNQPVAAPAIILLPIFLVGSCLWLYRDRVPDSAALAIASTAAAVVVLLAPIGPERPQFLVTSAGLAAPLLVYPVLWLGIHLPLRRIGRRNDYSYGVYLYAFPVTQALAMIGAATLGWWPFLAMVVAGTAVFAAGSWHLVESPAMRASRRSSGAPPSRDPRRSSPLPSPPPSVQGATQP
jgi:peptidoglycan/LPS O-acetylase OafA/YrhL